MNCPWCGNPLRHRPHEQAVRTKDGKLETDDVYECTSCSVTGNAKWWRDRIKDQRGLPKGDR